MPELNLEIEPPVVSFVEHCLVGLVFKDPVPVLIYGRFSDEEKDNFRVSLSERSELLTHAIDKGAIYRVSGLKELFVHRDHLQAIENKVMSLRGDTVVFSNRT